MKFFWPVYLSSVVIGTIGMYVVAPYARSYVAGLRGSGPSESAPLNAAAPVPTVAVAAAPVATPAREPLSEDREPVATPAQPQEDEDVPPAVSGIYLVSYGDRPGWGITNQRTVYYKPDGTRVGTVPGGVLFDMGATHKSTKGIMVECRFVEYGVTNGLFLVGRKDVLLFTASYTKLTPRQKEALKTYYALNGKIESRKAELLQAAAVKNPHLAEANAAYKAFNTHVEKAQALTLQRDRATDQERARIEDQLRELKVKEVQLKITLDAANRKFREWKLQHGNEIAKPESDPSIKQWTQEMAKFRPRVPGLAI